MYLYGSVIYTYHWLGMSAFVVTGVVVSLSQIVYAPATASVDEPQEYTTPIYVAVLFSLVMPALCLSFGMLAKYALVETEEEKKVALAVQRKLTANDYTFMYFLIMFGFSLCCSIVYFFQNPGIFEKDLFIAGTLGSGINVLGCLFMNTAVSTGNPLGPMFAL